MKGTLKIVLRLQWALLVLALASCTSSTPIFDQYFKPGVYAVKRGDTVYSISWRHGEDYRDVIRWNKLVAPYTIYPGQVLIIRGPSDKVTALGVTPGRAKKTAAIKKSTPKIKNTSAKRVKKKPLSAKVNTDHQWQWPAEGKLLSRFLSSALDRQGIDIKGIEGAKVVASLDGKVVYSGDGLRTYGRLIIIKHNDTFLSAYAHNSRLLVKEGNIVKSGQPIALVGLNNQGVAKLHFEIRKNGKPVDPLKYLPAH